LLRVQSQQLPTESQVLEDEVLPGTENADQPTEQMSKRHDHGKNCSGKIRIELCAKSFILQVYDVLARHTLRFQIGRSFRYAQVTITATLSGFTQTHRLSTTREQPDTF
jgi:hypothetical protein